VAKTTARLDSSSFAGMSIFAAREPDRPRDRGRQDVAEVSTALRIVLQLEGVKCQ
jgi:hypothetical protein